jgi:Uma2 family endonuclease
MSTTIERAPSESSSAPSNEEPRVLLHDVSWEQYESIGEALRDRPNLRLTYDDGELEIMTTSHRHEFFKSRLARLIDALAEEMEISLEFGGSMTFKKESLKRGLEPDECYWVAGEPLMRGRADYDPESDPPPDVVLEVEISRSALNRMSLYATLGVREVWRFNGKALRVYTLEATGAYRERTGSESFPGFPVEELARFAEPEPGKDSLARKREFRAWARAQLEEMRRE